MKEYVPTGHRVFRGGWSISYEVVAVEVSEDSTSMSEMVVEEHLDVDKENVAIIRV
ncbi:MAG: hypothetical protein K6F01_05080 [Selenomonas sp.]|uniref:hypothetical protein n=1 Tax=Selenomonas sp. TaxID=2053611 RepID=UPI0025D0F8DB|nr:hypothetical protein [Selenomonas sp.]MCR5438791.1 hypothetical protein [Selenomonas sp.]